MANEAFLTRTEIRRLILARLGMGTDAALSQQVWPQINASIDVAAQRVAQDCDWIKLFRAASVGVDDGVDFVAYATLAQAYDMKARWPNDYHPRTYGTADDPWVPPSALVVKAPTAAGIGAAALWDIDGLAYSRLIRTGLNVALSTDRLDDHVAEVALVSGGDAAEIASATAWVTEQQSTPTHYAIEATGLRLYPRPSDRIVLRVEYNVSPAWMDDARTVPDTTLDAMVSVVDAWLIVHAVCADMRLDGQDFGASQAFEAKYQSRFNALLYGQRKEEAFNSCADCTFEDLPPLRTPNYDFTGAWP